MKIGVISYHSSPLEPAGTGNSGGMNVSIYNLYKNLTHSCTIDIFSYGKEDCVRINQSIRVIFLPFKKMADFAAGVINYHLDQRYDLIHTHYWLSGLIGLLIKKSQRLPWVHTFHTVESLKGMKADQARIEVEEDIIRYCDLVVSPTKKERLAIKSIYPNAQVITLPHGVDIHKFTPGPNGSSHLLYVGRIDPLKGLDILIDAVRSIESEVKVNIIGGPSKKEEELDNLKTYADDLNINFIGPVQHNLLCDYYRKAGMVIIPSYYESFGLVGLEAMASARPVVGFDDTGLAETVGNDAGILVRRNPQNLASAINFLIENQNLRHNLGMRGRMKSLFFGWPKISKKYFHTYGEIIAR